jgi:hypothetical protein
MKYNYKLVLKKDNTENWLDSSYIPLDGEPCYDTDKKEFKIGNGVERFVNLPNILGSGNTDLDSTEFGINASYGAVTIGEGGTFESFADLKEWMKTEVFSLYYNLDIRLLDGDHHVYVDDTTGYFFSHFLGTNPVRIISDNEDKTKANIILHPAPNSGLFYGFVKEHTGMNLTVSDLTLKLSESSSRVVWFDIYYSFLALRRVVIHQGAMALNGRFKSHIVLSNVETYKMGYAWRATFYLADYSTLDSYYSLICDNTGEENNVIPLASVYATANSKVVFRSQGARKVELYKYGYICDANSEINFYVNVGNDFVFNTSTEDIGVDGVGKIVNASTNLNLADYTVSGKINVFDDPTSIIIDVNTFNKYKYGRILEYEEGMQTDIDAGSINSIVNKQWIIDNIKRRSRDFTAIGGETSIDENYNIDVSHLNLYINGVMVNPSDYSVSDNTITLNEALNENDWVRIESFTI